MRCKGLHQYRCPRSNGRSVCNFEHVGLNQWQPKSNERKYSRCCPSCQLAYLPGKRIGAGMPAANQIPHPFQFEQKITDHLPAVLPIFCQAALNGTVQCRRRLAAGKVLIGSGCFSSMGRCDAYPALARKGPLPRGHFIKHRAEGKMSLRASIPYLPPVRVTCTRTYPPRCLPQSAEGFGCEVSVRLKAEEAARGGGGFRQTEVHSADAHTGQHDVPGFRSRCTTPLRCASQGLRGSPFHI